MEKGLDLAAEPLREELVVAAVSHDLSQHAVDHVKDGRVGANP